MAIATEFSLADVLGTIHAEEKPCVEWPIQQSDARGSGLNRFLDITEVLLGIEQETSDLHAFFVKNHILDDPPQGYKLLELVFDFPDSKVALEFKSCRDKYFFAAVTAVIAELLRYNQGLDITGFKGEAGLMVKISAEILRHHDELIAAINNRSAHTISTILQGTQAIVFRSDWMDENE